jgi:hypothetical protein
VASRTQIVCLCEGRKGESVDEVFINALLKSLAPKWVRRQGSNIVRIVPCGGRNEVVEKTPDELQNCIRAGADTTLMVWADCDDCADGDALKAEFWRAASRRGVGEHDFDRIVFARRRLENWIEFLRTGSTDESKEGPRVKHNREAADAARELARLCRGDKSLGDLPPSLEWSCRNWRALAGRKKE